MRYFDILAVEFDSYGLPTESLSKTYSATVDETTYRIIKERGILYDFLFPVKKAGAYQLRVAVYDQTSRKIGSANQFIEISDFYKNNLMLSGIAVENIESRRLEKNIRRTEAGR